MSLISAFKPPSTRSGILKRRPLKKVLASMHLQSTVPDDEEEADHSSITPHKHTPKHFQRLRGSVAHGGRLRPFRLLRQDLQNLGKRYVSDWTVFNQLVFASAVYVFFTNLLPGITFASDLFVLTGQNWGTIEVVFSTGLCGIIFSLSVSFSRHHGLRDCIFLLLPKSRASFFGGVFDLISTNCFQEILV